MREKINPPRDGRITAVALLTVAAAFILSGCNMQSTKANNTSGGGPTVGSVVLSASSLSFGSLTVGSSKTMNITLTNSTSAGGPDVTVSQVKASGTGFTTTASASINLTPGQSTDIAVVFKPAASGSASGSLTFTLVGATNPAAIALSGSGTSNAAGAQLSVSPGTLSFGSVNVGSSKSLSGTVQATNGDVTVSSASWSGSGYAVSGITFPVTVKAGSSAPFTVTFTPQAAGAVPGQVSFISNATNSPAGETFSGTGVQGAVQHTVSLSWIPSTSSVVGYNVYRSAVSGGPYARINGAVTAAASYSDSSVQSGLTYFYVATAVDASSSESGYSGEVAAVIPAP